MSNKNTASKTRGGLITGNFGTSICPQSTVLLAQAGILFLKVNLQDAVIETAKGFFPLLISSLLLMAFIAIVSFLFYFVQYWSFKCTYKCPFGGNWVSYSKKTNKQTKKNNIYIYINLYINLKTLYKWYIYIYKMLTREKKTLYNVWGKWGTDIFWKKRQQIGHKQFLGNKYYLLVQWLWNSQRTHPKFPSSIPSPPAQRKLKKKCKKFQKQKERERATTTMEQGILTHLFIFTFCVSVHFNNNNITSQ